MPLIQIFILAFSALLLNFKLSWNSTTCPQKAVSRTDWLTTLLSLTVLEFHWPEEDLILSNKFGPELPGTHPQKEPLLAKLKKHSSMKISKHSLMLLDVIIKMMPHSLNKLSWIFKLTFQWLFSTITNTSEWSTPLGMCQSQLTRLLPKRTLRPFCKP